VTWDETVNHPGWFRIALQPNGETFSIPLASNGPDMDPSGGGCNNFPTENLEGMTDSAGALILKDRILDGTESIQVALPNMECDNCTLQFIQVMTDKCPYTVDVNSDDIYFNCADITLSNSAPPPTDAGVPDPDGGNGGGGGDTSGGCASAPGAGLLVGLAFLGMRRRSRR
jgi:hypothetical protein